MIDGWASYALSDFLMFSAASYFRRYELANAELWPAQMPMAVAAAAALWLRYRRLPRAELWIALLLASAWALVAGGFLHRHYAQINLAADWFALVFLLQAAMLIAGGVYAAWRQPAFDPGAPRAWHPGMLLFAYAMLVHPLIGVLAGRSWQGVELFGVAPDATALATLGILLLGLRAAYWPLLIVPLVWCGASALTYLAMGHAYGVLPLAAAITAWVATIVLRYRQRSWHGG